MPATASERMAAARTAVDRACQLLLSPTPEQMDRCTHLLEKAVSELNSIPDGTQLTGASKAKALLETHRLASSLHRARRLLESAVAFHANWIRCLAALCSGYTSQGQPAALQRGRVLVRG